jgi:hypothetical protein
MSQPNPSKTIVTRTEGYTYAARVWALCVVQGPLSVAPCQTLIVRIRIKQSTPLKGPHVLTSQQGALLLLLHAAGGAAAASPRGRCRDIVHGVRAAGAVCVRHHRARGGSARCAPAAARAPRGDARSDGGEAEGEHKPIAELIDQFNRQ